MSKRHHPEDRKEIWGSVFKPSPETNLFTLTAIQSFSLNRGTWHNPNQNWQEGKTPFTRWGEPMSRHATISHSQPRYLGALQAP